jgi:MFS family permease
MSFITEKAQWVYKEFGLRAVYETGKDCWIIVLLRFFRMFAYGSNSLILALFFTSLRFSDGQIGIFMTLTLLGDVLLSLLLTLVADRIGRRRILFGGSLLMVLAGTTFAIFENFWILLIAAVVGVISATGSEIGPFRAIEESTLSSLTTPETRTSVLSWYVATATLGSSIGSEAAGRMVEWLHSGSGWELKDAYHSMFWVYTGMGAINMALAMLLSSKCELAPVAQTQDSNRESGKLLDGEESEQDGEDDGSTSTISKPTTAVPEKRKGLIAQISPETRAVLYKLCSLFALDSLASGMTPWSLINLYVDNRFGLPKDQLGHIVSYFIDYSQFKNLIPSSRSLLHTFSRLFPLLLQARWLSESDSSIQWSSLTYLHQSLWGSYQSLEMSR